MADWTPEARDYLDGYLRQVGALARGQGDDADDIVTGLREHVINEVEAESGSLITLDALRKTLATVGTPEQVVSPDFSLSAAMEHAKHAGAVSGGAAHPRKSRSGCVIATMVFLAFALVVAIAIPLLIVASLLFRTSVREVVPGEEVGPGLALDPQSGYPEIVITTLEAVAAAEEDFRQRAELDFDEDGVADYATADRLLEGTDLHAEVDEAGDFRVLAYTFHIEVTASGEAGGPAFQCTVSPPSKKRSTQQWAQIDQTGELRMIEPPLAALKAR
jgi:hypothetical protein